MQQASRPRCWEPEEKMLAGWGPTDNSIANTKWGILVPNEKPSSWHTAVWWQGDGSLCVDLGQLGFRITSPVTQESDDEDPGTDRKECCLVLPTLPATFQGSAISFSIICKSHREPSGNSWALQVTAQWKPNYSLLLQHMRTEGYICECVRISLYIRMCVSVCMCSELPATLPLLCPQVSVTVQCFKMICSIPNGWLRLAIHRTFLHVSSFLSPSANKRKVKMPSICFPNSALITQPNP